MSLRRPLRHRMRGMTLVELMIGLTIGLFLVGIAGSLFLGSRLTFNAQSQVARLQEGGRFVAERLGTDLRMAGFRGCRGQGAGTTLTNLLRNPGNFQIDFARGLQVSRHDGGAWQRRSTPRSPGCRRHRTGRAMWSRCVAPSARAGR